VPSYGASAPTDREPLALHRAYTDVQAPNHSRAANDRSLAALHHRSAAIAMKGVKKQHLPTKTCATCGRPFVWRKKWERDWEQVRYCSDRCRRGNGNNPGNGQAPRRVQ